MNQSEMIEKKNYEEKEEFGNENLNTFSMRYFQ